MNKKLLILLAFVIPFLTIGAGCATVKPIVTNDQQNSNIVATNTTTNFADDKLAEYKNSEFGFSFVYPAHWQKFSERKSEFKIEDMLEDPATGLKSNPQFLKYKDNIIKKIVGISVTDEYQNFKICPENLFPHSSCSVDIKIEPLNEKEYMRLNCYEGSCDLENLNQEKINVKNKKFIMVDGSKGFLEEKHNFLNYYIKSIQIFEPNYLFTLSLVLPVPDTDYYNTSTYNKTIDLESIVGQHNSAEYNYLKKVIKEFDNLLETFKFNPTNPNRIAVPELGFSYELSDWDRKNFPVGHVRGNQLIFGYNTDMASTGFIERLPRTTVQGFQDVVQQFLLQHGYDTNLCALTTNVDANTFGRSLIASNMSALFVKSSSTEQFTEKHCGGIYAVRRGYFLTDTTKTNAPILYINFGVDGAGIMYSDGPFQFLP